GAVAAADGAAVVVAVAGPAGPVAESRQVDPGELVADCLVHHRLHAAGRAAGSQRHGSRAGPRGSLHWRAVRLSLPRTGFNVRLRYGLVYRIVGDVLCGNGAGFDGCWWIWHDHTGLAEYGGVLCHHPGSTTYFAGGWDRKGCGRRATGGL